MRLRLLALLRDVVVEGDSVDVGILEVPDPLPIVDV